MGFDLKGFLRVAGFVAGPVLTAVGVPAPVVPLVIHGIQVAENATNGDGSPKTGAEKKAIALDAVQTGIAAVNAVKPNSIDPDVIKVVDNGIDTTVGVINAIQKKPIS